MHSPEWMHERRLSPVGNLCAGECKPRINAVLNCEEDSDTGGKGDGWNDTAAGEPDQGARPARTARPSCHCDPEGLGVHSAAAAAVPGPHLAHTSEPGIRCEAASGAEHRVVEGPGGTSSSKRGFFSHLRILELSITAMSCQVRWGLLATL